MYKENHWMCPKNTIKKNCVDGRFTTTMLIYSPIGRQLSGLYKINILFQA
jgi:hypothetical protein